MFVAVAIAPCGSVMQKLLCALLILHKIIKNDLLTLSSSCVQNLLILTIYQKFQLQTVTA